MRYRPSIDFGIHMGLSHAAMAVVEGESVRVVKTNSDQDRTPCCVYINKYGQIHTGRLAKNRLGDPCSVEDIYLDFMRRLGTDHLYAFKSSGLTMRPEELVAAVIQSLREDAQQRLGEDVLASVLTVPNWFGEKECQAMQMVGEQGGLEQVVLLQEPMAAALAYGMYDSEENRHWMTYAFTGHSFDTAVMEAKGGTIAVVNHGGDNHLGGSEFDWAVIEQIIIPEIAGQYNLPDFQRGNRRWAAALAIIRRSVELAKIQLSRSDMTYLEGCHIKDAGGEIVEIEHKLTRDSLVSVAEPFIMRSVDICRRVLKEKNLAPSAIEKIVLVGGPTLAPYFREILLEELGIPLDLSVDPVTAVVRGAAIFAASQPNRTNRAPSVVKPAQYKLDLRYKPVGVDDDPTVRGIVEASSGESLAGFTIEFVNKKTKWRSVRVPVRGNGRFRVQLLAEKGRKNDFEIQLTDARGTRVACMPRSIPYTVGKSILEQPIIHSIGIACGVFVDVLFPKGARLPLKAVRNYLLPEGLSSATPAHVFALPIVEGESPHAQRNPLLGKLTISGSQVRRDVPAGSEIEVTINMDASRIIRAKAYIPVLDEEYEAVIDYNNATPDATRLGGQFDRETTRYMLLEGALRHGSNSDQEKTYDSRAIHVAFDDVRKFLAAAKVEPDAAWQAERHLLHLQTLIDELEVHLRSGTFSNG